MKRLNLRLLEVFRVVFEAGSVTTASIKLGVTQPAVSKALVELERDVNLTLFGRERRRLIPTEDAARLYEETTRLFSHVSVFEDRVEDFRSGEAGQIDRRHSNLGSFYRGSGNGRATRKSARRDCPSCHGIPRRSYQAHHASSGRLGTCARARGRSRPRRRNHWRK